jgi:AcrR family transcriptional regulator
VSAGAEADGRAAADPSGKLWRAMSLVPDGSGSHRERLLAGMAAAIREHGFGPTTVAEVVAHARTSRRTFYQHFDDREDCFLALNDLLTERLLEVIAEAATGEENWEERVDRTLVAYLGALASEPELTRACIVEVPALGPEGLARTRALKERAAHLLCRLVEEAREHDPHLRPLSLEAALMLVGGFEDLVLWALEHGRDLTELQAVAGDLVRRITIRDGGPPE